MKTAVSPGEGVFTGTLELGEARAGESRGLLPATAEQLKNNGGVSQSAPYEATVDGDGYLTELKVTLPTYTSLSLHSGFGQTVKIPEPGPGEVTEVPDGVRRILAG